MTHIGVLHISAAPQTCHDVDDTRCSGVQTIPGGAESLKPTSLMCSGPGAVYVDTCSSTVYLLSFPSGGSRSRDSNCRPGICSRNSVLESNRRQQTRHTSHSSGKHLGKIAERKDLSVSKLLALGPLPLGLWACVRQNSMASGMHSRAAHCMVGGKQKENG